MNIETAASQLEALGNATRLTIYRTLVRAGFGGLPVGKLQLKLDIPSSTERPEATPEPHDRGEALAELVARIGDDARRDPQGYLGRTVVPEGGE